MYDNSGESENENNANNKNNDTFCMFKELLNESTTKSIKQNSSVERDFAKYLYFN